VGYEYTGPPGDPQKREEGQQGQAIPPASSHAEEQYEEPMYREHVSGPLNYPVVPTAPLPPQAQPQYGQYGQYGPQHYGQQGAQRPLHPQGPQGQSPMYGPYYGNQYAPNGANVPYGQPGQPGPQGQPVPYGHYGYPQHPGYGYGYPAQPVPYGYPGYPGYPGYARYQYYPQPYYPYPYFGQPVGPRRDRYLFVMAILSTIGSSLAFLGGLFCILGISVAAAQVSTLGNQAFGSIVLFTALTIAGLAGGGFGLYHSIRSLAKKPSAQFKLPWYWLFLALYILVIIIAVVLRANGQAISNIPFTVFLIAFAGILPALTFLSLGVRRLHLRGSPKWPTRWRRFTLAIVSGATAAIVLASIAELILTVVAAQAIGLTGSLSSIDNPNAPIPSDPRYIAFLLILVSVIAPLVEEGVKPLAVIAMIGRIESAAEAFVLGLSCGIGFDLIETSGYISQGNQNWVDVALQRSTAGLLHGFGAAMVSLGWYFITHRKGRNNSVLLGIGCILYAVLQHAIWNGSFVLQLLPSPIGPYLASGNIGSGAFAFPAFLLVYVILSLLMLIFFLFVTGRIRPKRMDTPTNATPTAPNSAQEGRREPQVTSVQTARV